MNIDQLKKQSRLKEFSKQDSQVSVPQHPNPNSPYRDQGCYQRGCMLPGSMSQSTHGQGPWWCQEHFNR